ncbi:hypothetical protein [Nonomuraea angiospora]|uniref:hypothetical protein n=1 Tax=Nonomuraea angiospora TaxID=46172 RepID=UPI0029AF131F|nr:hypothetical protein [Nonomuraea angiospora]MDX3109560.1 hypothetical protein [Nonomuraea angiospora]
MPQQHNPQPDGDGQDSAEKIITIVQNRARRAATAARWAARTAEVNAEIQAELAQSIDERAQLHDEVTMWRRVAAKRAGLDPSIPPPPQQYIDALRAAQHEPCRQVTVDIDGQPWIAGFAPHSAAAPNPERELKAWAQFVTAVRAARAALAVTA